MVEPANVTRATGRPLQALASWPVAEGDEDRQSKAARYSPEPEFISIPEWARRLAVSPESGYKAARLGQIPGCFNIGRLYRVNWPKFVEATAYMRDGASEVR